MLDGAVERDPDKRLAAEWLDRSNPDGEPVHIRVDPSREIIEGSVAVLSYGDYFDEYCRHPEAKMLSAEGRPCHPWTRGVLTARHVTPAGGPVRIGKESNRLSETPMPLELDEEAAVVYPAPRTCPGCGATVAGRRKWCSEACRKRTARVRLDNSTPVEHYG